ncbi:hypothetical protein AZE42_13508, partial [Rhizopogon vesiculosus]
MAPLLVISL